LQDRRVNPITDALARAANPSGQQTIAEVIAAHAASNPEGAAFIAGKARMSWQQYRDWSDLLAAALIEGGFRRGERIAVLLPDGCETHVCYTACEKAGLIAVAIASRAGEKEIEHLLNVSGARALLTPERHEAFDVVALFASIRKKCPELQHHLQLRDPVGAPDALLVDGVSRASSLSPSLLAQIEARRTHPDELFLLNSTSGTTGMPKCVMQNQRRWFAYAALAQDSAPLTGRDVFLRAIPASVGFGLWTGHFVPTLLGATTVVLPKFKIEALLEAIQSHRVTVLAAVSTQFIMMLNHPELDRYDLSSLRLLYTGGEAVPYERAARFEERTGATVLQFYGSNETGALSYTTVRDSRTRRLTTAGRTIECMHVRLIDDRGADITAGGRGQPVCKGPVTCMGYFNDEVANRKLYTADGSMKMEDLVTLDHEGYLSVIGRVGDFIIRGGKNISAVAVEEAALAHPSVRMAAAVPAPDAVFGERVCLYLVPALDRAITLPELVSFLESQGVSREYFPEHLVIVDELPSGSGGKVAKHLLKADIKARLGA